MIKPLLILMLACCAFGATYSPSVGDLDSIQAAVALADTGDTVNVPAGSWAWKIESSGNPSLALTKPIYLKGSGHTSCTVIGDTSSTDGESCIYSLNKSTHLLRISGIKFTQYSYTNGSNAAVEVGNQNWRIDHCVFDTSNVSGARGIQATGFGLIDSCYIYDNTQGVKVNGVAGSTDTYEGDSLWAIAGYDTLGTANAVYVEDCKFYYASLRDGCLDAYAGKFVFRHNEVVQTNIGWHGYDSGPRRSAIGWEIYDNVFTWAGVSTLFCVINARGGTGVVYNNAATGVIGSYILLQNYRDWTAGPDEDICDGGAAIDSNRIGGYPCYDQIGMGAQQKHKPVYCWGNTDDGDTIVPTLAEQNVNISKDRDYFESAKPGYAAYTYPHPTRGPFYKHDYFTHTVTDTAAGIIRWNVKAWVRVDTSSDHSTWGKLDSISSTANHLDTISPVDGKYHRTIGRSVK